MQFYKKPPSREIAVGLYIRDGSNLTVCRVTRTARHVEGGGEALVWRL